MKDWHISILSLAIGLTICIPLGVWSYDPISVTVQEAGTYYINDNGGVTKVEHLQKDWEYWAAKFIYAMAGLGLGLLVLGGLFYKKISSLIFPALDAAMAIVEKDKPTAAEAELAKGIFISIGIRIAAVIFLVTMFALYL